MGVIKDGRASSEECLEHLTEGWCGECKSSKLEMVERQAENRSAIYSNKILGKSQSQRSERNACHSGKRLKTGGKWSLAWSGLEVCSHGSLWSLLSFNIPLLNLGIAKPRHPCASLLSCWAVPGVCCWSQHCCVGLTQFSSSGEHHESPGHKYSFPRSQWEECCFNYGAAGS